MLHFTITELLFLVKRSLSPVTVTVHAALFHLCLGSLIRSHSAHHNVITLDVSLFS